ncbi:MAG: serpin family protein [Bacteroidales bacterium]|nr:serpin family protein [Bacteroidales bacterium]HOO67315.1 serpin family protein [Bacteroidales bacterium]HPE23439.1 serpin family protein [Bacteroidales bacterium]HPJ05678.1 serpin family protein [Bacteroidales bacterium]HPQ64336.1 serpin family protein [Bacteroidales bacterium]
MKSSFLNLAIVFVAGTTGQMASCEKQPERTLPSDPVEIELTLKQREVVTSANRFAFDLFKPVVAGEEQGTNIMISPFSITSALSMTLNGAAGETFDAVKASLRYDAMSLDEVNDTYRKLVSEMVPVDERVVMEIANSVWVENQFPVKDEFIEALKKWYLAEARNFSVSDPGSVNIINGWIEEKTHDRIQKMISRLDPDLAMLLINAVYFNGKWKHQFDPELTTDRPFYISSGDPVNVPMMYQKEKFAVSSTDRVTLAELPYGQGNYSMVVALPDEGITPAEILSGLDAGKWEEWMQGLSYGQTEVRLYMPKFKYEYKRRLNDDLISLGMGPAFDPGTADFSKISDVEVFISFVLHQTFIENKEEGTEAAAATVVGFTRTSLPPEPQVINLNRPFLYFIRETTTGTIVFMGLVADPEA